MNENSYMIQFPTFSVYIWDEALFFVREMQGILHMHELGVSFTIRVSDLF